MTNLPGILILGLAKAQLIQIFFFRLNLLITLLGLLHGLAFLPIILSYLGEFPGPPAGTSHTWAGATGAAWGAPVYQVRCSDCAPLCLSLCRA